MKKISIWGVILLVVLFIQIPICIANDVQNNKQSLSNDSVTGQQLFKSAYDSYFNAQIAEDSSEVSKMYAKAITDISKAVTLEQHNSDYWILGSLIWRGKGGISYAKGYFNNSELLLNKKLKENPADIGANLDYAILCYAGDVRFWENYPFYENVAKEYARKTIDLCESKLEKEENSNLVRVIAMSKLILDKPDECKELLIKAKNIDLKKAEFSIMKFLGLEIKENTGKSSNAFYEELYENTISKNRWFWYVESHNIPKEFLLYYITDGSRNNNL